MNLILTDSGFGGLFLCSQLLQNLASEFNFSSENKPAPHNQSLSSAETFSPLQIHYINAAPSNEQGYNDLNSRSEKRQRFNHFLEQVQLFYAPDLIYVACNSLSVLLQELPFTQNPSASSIQGIVTQGKDILKHSLPLQTQKNSATFFIFGTETTISDGSYTQILKQEGVPQTNIVEQACSGLATEISNDVEGRKVASSIEAWVDLAVLKWKEQKLQSQDLQSQAIFLFMGCTHYGSRQEYFQKAFHKLGYTQVQILDPNQEVVHTLAAHIRNHYRHSKKTSPIQANIQFISPYVLPENEVQTLSTLLHPISPETVDALQNYRVNLKFYDSEKF